MTKNRLFHLLRCSLFLYNGGVRRYLRLALLIALLFFVSCSSTRSASSSSDEEKTAVLTLASDMTESFSASLSTDDIAQALSSSYTFYSDYLPSFSAVKERYLSSIINILEDDFTSCFISIISSQSEKEAETPGRFIDGELLSLSLETATRATLTSDFEEIISKHTLELDEAFSESENTFSCIQRSYRSLVIVDISLSIPDPEPIETNKLINLVLDKYFSSIKENETKLRNNPFYGESSYRLFWR